MRRIGGALGVAVYTLLAHSSRRVVRSSRTRLTDAGLSGVALLLRNVFIECRSIVSLLLTALPRTEIVYAIAALTASALATLQWERARRLDRICSSVTSQSTRLPADAIALLRRLKKVTGSHAAAWGRIRGVIRSSDGNDDDSCIHRREDRYRRTRHVRRVTRSVCVKRGRAPNGAAGDAGSDSEYEEWSEDEEYWQTTCEYTGETTSSAMWVDGGGECESDSDRSAVGTTTARACKIALAVPPAWGTALTTHQTPETRRGSNTRTFAITRTVPSFAAFEGAGQLLLVDEEPMEASSEVDAAHLECGGGGGLVWMLAPAVPTARGALARLQSHGGAAVAARDLLTMTEPPLVTLDEIEGAASDAALVALVAHLELERTLALWHLHSGRPPAARRRRLLADHLFCRGVGLLMLSQSRAQRPAARDALNSSATNRRIAAFIGLAQPSETAGARAMYTEDEYERVVAVADEAHAASLAELYAAGDDDGGIFRVPSESYHASLSAASSAASSSSAAGATATGAEKKPSTVVGALAKRARWARVAMVCYALLALLVSARGAFPVLRGLLRALRQWRRRRTRGGRSTHTNIG